MSVRTLDPSALRRLGLEALVKALGPVDAARFLQQFGSGAGDYTKDRDTWLKDVSLESLLQEIEERSRPTQQT
jgi:hypothetical protein